MTDDDVKTTIEAGIRYARLAERLGGALVQLRAVNTTLVRVVDLDEELAPEIHAAMEHVNEVVAAVSRAHDFAAARLDVRLGKNP